MVSTWLIRPLDRGCLSFRYFPVLRVDENVPFESKSRAAALCKTENRTTVGYLPKCLRDRDDPQPLVLWLAHIKSKL